MPDHPRRRVKRHVNLLRDYESPTAACLMVKENSEEDFGPAGKEEGEGMPAISERLDEEEKEKIWELLRRYERILGGEPGRTKAASIKIETGSACPIQAGSCQNENDG